MGGFFGIGVWHAKTSHNIGTLWRSANSFGASWIFAIGARYRMQSSDTLQTPKRIPLYHYQTFEQFYANMPYDCMLTGVELGDRSMDIKTFSHPQRCVYLLGSEDAGLPESILEKCHTIIRLPGEPCLNVAVAGSIVMYDRMLERNSV